MALEHNLLSEGRRIEDTMALNQSELLMAEETAKRCREDQYKLRTLLSSTKAVTSQLPFEVLGEIFVAALPGAEFSLPYMSRYLPQEFILARVCQTWREIAWKIPRLWCRINIRLNRKRFKTQKCLIEEWIQRSGKCPLEIWIQREFVIDKWEPPRGAFDIIIQSCTRWKTFVCPAFTSLSMALESGVTLGFPLLKTLALNNNPALMKPSDKWNFGFPPQLQSLDIQDSLLYPSLMVNWNALTTLNANILLGPSLNDIKEYIPLTALLTCKSLVNLKAYDLKTSIVDPNHVFQTAICFPSLQKLSINAASNTIVQFMAMTKLPSLIDLFVFAERKFANIRYDPAWTIALVDWAKRSSFKLQSLAIWSDNLGQDRHISDLIRQLSPSQPLKSLTIIIIDDSDFYLSDSLINQLTMKPDEGVENQLPHLGFFHFCGKISFTLSAMMSMLESRKSHEESVKNLAMPGCSSMDERKGEGGRTDSPETLTVKMQFANRRSWLTNENPNNLRAFYQTVESFDKDGRNFTLDWETFGEAEED